MKKKIWSLLSAIVFTTVIVALMFAGCGVASAFKPTAKEYSFVIIPDTQAMAQSNPLNFMKMTKWIVDNQKALNIKMVLHVGDVVNKGSGDEPQYRKAKDALDLIDKSNIPMLIAPGNHDYDNMLKNNRNSTLFNKYFGMDRYKGKSWFGDAFEEGKSESVYARMQFEGKKYLFFALEFGPRDKVMSWVESIAAKYPDHDVIITTHTYIHKDGGRTAKETEGSPQKYTAGADGNDGEAMWQESLKKMKNLTAVYSGHHFNPNISWQTDLGDNGNLVFQSMQDFQAMSDRAGRIRIVKYIPAEDKVELKVMNTLTGQYEQGGGYDVTYSTKKPVDPKEWKQIKFPETKLPETKSPASNKSGVVQISALNKITEVVTVVNTTGTDINMTGWQIDSVNMAHPDDPAFPIETFYFPEGFVLKAGAAVQIVSDKKAEPGEGKIVWDTDSHWYNKDKNNALLYNDKGEKVFEFVDPTASVEPTTGVAGNPDPPKAQPAATPAPATTPSATAAPAPAATPAPTAKPGGIEIADVKKAAQPEVVIIANNSGTDVNMSGWRIDSVNMVHPDDPEFPIETYKFPEGFVLKAGATIQIVSDKKAEAGEGKLLWDTDSHWYNKDSNAAQLFNKSGEKVFELVR